jgi:hypothetical protein
MSDRLLVATRKGLFTVDRTNGAARSSWAITRTAFLADPVPIVLPDSRDGSVYVALDLGHFGSKMHHSADGGDTWQEVGLPIYPTPNPGEEDVAQEGAAPIRWRLERIWALEAGLADQPGVLWCGTIPGGLFRSNDHARSWEIVRSLWYHPKRKEWFGGGAIYPGIHSVCVHPGNGGHVSVGVSCGGVWVTTDGGETWNCRASGMFAEYMPPERRDDPNIQDAHRMVQCPAKPECLWVQHHNGIFRSTDGSTSWHEVKNVPPSSFGFAVAVHPKDPDAAWFIPAVSDQRRIPAAGRVVATRTRDGGRSFEVLSRGLPQEHAYDITYRHGLDIDDSGDRLAFGSTTGSLWVTENQGDSWQCVAEHLPPVYCVRFVK